MNLLNAGMRAALVIMISVGLAACKVELTSVEDDDDQEDKPILVIERSMSGKYETIDHHELYDFELKGDGNSLLFPSGKSSSILSYIGI